MLTWRVVCRGSTLESTSLVIGLDLCGDIPFEGNKCIGKDKIAGGFGLPLQIVKTDSVDVVDACPSPPPPTPPAPPPSAPASMPTGEIVGIGAGVAAVVLLAGVFVCRRCRRPPAPAEGVAEACEPQQPVVVGVDAAPLIADAAPPALPAATENTAEPVLLLQPAAQQRGCVIA